MSTYPSRDAFSRLIQPPKMPLGVQGLYEISSTQKFPMGTPVQLNDGRKFVYGQAGASALAYGKLAMEAAAIATATDEVVSTSAAVGDDHIHVTFGGAVTANQFAGGYLWVNDDTGEGQMYSVKSHAAGTTAVQVNLYDTIRVAVTAGAGTVSAIVHPCRGLIISAATAGAPIGVPLVTVTELYYAWFQVKGPATVLTAGTLVIGQQAVQAAGGAVAPLAETEILPICGTVLAVNATTEYSAINLSIPGF